MGLRDARVVAILPAQNIERARGFYGGDLGLRSPVDLPVPDGGAIYECGDGTLLYLYQRPTGAKADYTVAGWLIEDIEETVHALREKGVHIEQYNQPGLRTNAVGIAEVGGRRQAWFRDSEGNILSVIEMFPGAPEA